MGRANWPQSRTPPLLAPTLDAVGGRSYTQAIQTPGALGGRRGRETWFSSGPVDSATAKTQVVRVVGSPWRPLIAFARVRMAPAGGHIRIDILVPKPGDPFGGLNENLLQTAMIIADGDLEASIGIPKLTKRYPPFDSLHGIYPIGTLIWIFVSSTTLPGDRGEDLTIELDYLARAVGQ